MYFWKQIRAKDEHVFETFEAEPAFKALRYDWLTSFDPTMVKLFLLRDFVKKYSSNGKF